jgi:hypothetical protein
MIVFTHVPKTGGMAVRGLLEMALPVGSVWTAPRQVDQHGQPLVALPHSPTYNHTCAELVRLCYPNAKAIIGHWGYDFARLAGITDPVNVTILRDPIARVVSLWRYTGCLDVDQFFYQYSEATNGMVRRFGGDVQAAVDAVDSFNLVGFVDHFGQFALSLGRLIGKPRPWYCRANQSLKANGPSPALLAAIKHRNQLDIQFYEIMRGRRCVYSSLSAAALHDRNKTLAPVIKIYQRVRRVQNKLHREKAPWQIG